MVASAEPVAPARSRPADIETPQPAVEPEPVPVSQPVAQAYAPQQTRTIAPTTPVVAGLASASSVPLGGTPVRAAPLPPNRPFDLDTIANAAKPVQVPTLLRTTMPPARAKMASLFAAPEKGPTERFSKSHPLNKLAPQALQSLARN